MFTDDLGQIGFGYDYFNELQMLAFAIIIILLYLGIIIPRYYYELKVNVHANFDWVDVQITLELFYTF